MLAAAQAGFDSRQHGLRHAHAGACAGRGASTSSVRTETAGLPKDDTTLFEPRDGEAALATRKARLARAQALFRQYVPEGSPSLADELISERRAEVALEFEGWSNFSRR